MFDFDTATNEIFLYDEIGPSWAGMIDASVVINALAEMSGRVTVRINSPGGSVDEGIAIFNALKRHTGGVDTVADSLAASISSYILQAGETRRVADNSMVMIHDPWTIALGNAEELRAVADIIDKYKARIVPEYASRASIENDEVSAMMSAETWMTGEEAINSGLADELEGTAVEPVAVSDGLLARFKNAPEALIKRDVAAGTKTPYPRNRELSKIKTKLLT